MTELKALEAQLPCCQALKHEHIANSADDQLPPQHAAE